MRSVGFALVAAVAACSPSQPDSPATREGAGRGARATPPRAVAPIDAAHAVPIDAARAVPAPAADAETDPPARRNAGARADAAVAATPAAATPRAPAADERPRDLRVLPKTWSQQRVKRYMKTEVAKALGVQCDFCHDRSDFAADHEHKAAARAMMKMVNDINKRFFKGKSRVRCVTCHMGKDTPRGGE